MASNRRALGAGAAAMLVAGWAAAQPKPLPPLALRQLTNVSTGSYVFATHAPGDYQRLFLVRQDGRIMIVRLATLTRDETPFLVVPTSSGGETGLLGLAFHPEYAQNGYLYVYFNRTGATATTPVVMRYTRSATNPDLADPDSAQQVLAIGGGNGIHNGGWIGFHPDGTLYILTGERGNSANAFDLTDNLSGKLLRVDVNGDDFPEDPLRNYRIPPGNPFVGILGDDEIYAYGFRNPWRAYITPQGDMFIADVGTTREELNYLPNAAAGRDFGWPCQEGATNNCTTRTPTLPFAHYRSPAAPPLNITGNAVIGGEVYHGCAIPPLAGRYFFGDLSGDKVSLLYDGATLRDVIDHTAALAGITPYGFGHDAFGELYICGPGRVAKIVSAIPIGRDCNGNGVADRCDIAGGASQDSNGDGVPDECPPAGDIDGDGAIGLTDLARLLRAFGSCAGAPSYDSAADFDGDACVALPDLALLLRNFAG